MFNLPKSTEVNRVIPKNTFDSYTNTKQKKLFTDSVLRITWKNKISLETTNLGKKEIEEIQVFDIELKEKKDIKELLNIIQRAIPYHIIFRIYFNQEHYFTTAAKHSKANNENEAVIDYTFTSEWMPTEENPYSIELKNDLDGVFKHFCEHFSDIKTASITHLVKKQIEQDKLLREIEHLKSQIAKCKQFNQKVEFSLKLKALKKQINSIS